MQTVREMYVSIRVVKSVFVERAVKNTARHKPNRYEESLHYKKAEDAPGLERIFAMIEGEREMRKISRKGEVCIERI